MDIVIKELKEQLAAARAHNKILRDALDHHQEMTRPIERTQIALAMPVNDTSLKALLSAEREKCIDACMRGDYEYKTARECVDAIRALGAD